jgi:hypothetical protein
MFESISKFDALLSAVRQWKFPAEFRIAWAAWSEEMDERLVAALARAVEGVGARQEPEEDPCDRRARDAGRVDGWQPALDDRDLTAIGTRLWRLRDEIRSGEGSPAALRRAARHVEALWERLAEAGLKIYDHTGEEECTGQSFEVIAYQPTGEVTRPQVIETVRPTIRFNKKLIQLGQVIVGTPQR